MWFGVRSFADAVISLAIAHIHRKRATEKDNVRRRFVLSISFEI